MAAPAERRAADGSRLVIALALLLSLAAQDTTALSPRARAMLDRFPPPRAGDVSVATRFSTDTAWRGEQVELVTAAWFPRELRDRLRRPPTLRSPSLSGLWSVQSQSTPALAATRLVGGQVYDLFVAHQTLFPLGEGTITAPPATLSFAVPASVSFFAPENRRMLSSRAVNLVVRPIPASLAGPLGGGPTARALALTWRVPVEGLKAGTPAVVELIVAGEGNLTLWPVPAIAWPGGVRVYTERTDERASVAGGRIAGEKRFRFTVVADSEGVVTLPRVRYPYFDPAQVEVRVASTGPVSLPVLAAGRVDGRRALPLSAGTDVPLATRITHRWWPLLVLIALLPFVRGIVRRRQPRVRTATQRSSGEDELRRLLGAPVDAGPERVAGALRRRGIARPEAEAVRHWLAASVRRRYGPGVAPDAAAAPPILDRILATLRRAMPWALVLCMLPAALRAQRDVAIDRYRAGDYVGAARTFNDVLDSTPDDAAAWRNLAAARTMARDEVGAAAALVRALELAPRNQLARSMWNNGADVPPDVRLLAPRIPLNRDELLLVALGCWIVTAFAWRRYRPVALGVLALLVVACAVLGVRWEEHRDARALARPGAQLRVSPHPSAPSLGDVALWSVVTLERSAPGWILVASEAGRRGWVADGAIARLGAAAR